MFHLWLLCALLGHFWLRRSSGGLRIFRGRVESSPHVGANSAWNTTEPPRWMAHVSHLFAPGEKQPRLKNMHSKRSCFHIFKNRSLNAANKEPHRFKCSSPYKCSHIVRQGLPVFIIHSHKMFSFHSFCPPVKAALLEMEDTPSRCEALASKPEGPQRKGQH